MFFSQESGMDTTHRSYDVIAMGRSSIDLYSNDIGAPFVDITSTAGAEVQTLPVDLAANARSLGAHVIECKTYADFVSALDAARATDRTSVIYIQNDRYVGVPGYESWWDVP